MREISNEIFMMEKVKSSNLMVQSTMATGNKEKSMVPGNTYIQMERCMKVKWKMVNQKEKAYRHGLIQESIRVCGKMISLTGKESLYGQMEKCLLGISQMDSHPVKGSRCIQIEGFMKESL